MEEVKKWVNENIVGLPNSKEELVKILLMFKNSL